MNKKGISALIAWVLLIGFTIATAAFVTNWVIEQTKKFDPEEVVGGSHIYCDDVILSIEGIQGSESSGVFTGTITLKNKGKFTIHEIKGLGQKIGIEKIKLLPGESKDASISFEKYSEGNEIEIIPEIEVEGEKYHCSDGSAVINDIILASIQPLS